MNTIIGKQGEKHYFIVAEIGVTEIFSSSAKLAQNYGKSPENTVNGALAIMNHGDLQREGSKILWKEVKTTGEKGL